MMKKSRMYKYLILIVIVLSIGIGYAFLTVDLKINGTVGINDSRWNVHFANYQQTSNSTITPTNGNAPVITGDTTTEISYNVTFNEPGDVYEFTVDIVNGGTMEATITSLETDLKIGDNAVSYIPNYLEYSLTYSNGDEFVIPHGLAAWVSEKVLVRVEFMQNISIEQYEEAAGKTFHFDLKPIYVQGDGSAQDSNYHYLYSNDSEFFYTGQTIPAYAYVYDDYKDFDTNVFLRLSMDGDIIAKADVGFIADGNTYFIPTYDVYDQFDEVADYLLSFISVNDSCRYVPGYKFDCQNIYLYYSEGITIYDGSFFCNANNVYSYCS